MVACGQNKIDKKIARNATEFVDIERRNSLTKRLKNFKDDHFKLVALEQSDQSRNLFEYEFDRKTVLLIGHERLGVSDPDLALADDVIEIQVYGQPFSYNVVTATTMAVYEYCRQFPNG